MVEDLYSLISALVFCALWVIFLWYRQRQYHVDQRSATATVQRLLKPRTPDACPACRRQFALPLTAVVATCVIRCETTTSLPSSKCVALPIYVNLCSWDRAAG